ncbi:hypothetical protein K4K53_008853 [Colletotrichum sp. SAR 10_77]|nr:hypothetical protein K4K53_008853 [Colletotrichum sp. SAR 10_77]
MTNMGLVNNINNFLDSYRPSPTPDLRTPGVQRDMGPVRNVEEPSDTYFRDAIWSYEEYDSSSGGSFPSSQEANMLFTYARSESSQLTTDNSSIHTPPPPDDVTIDKPEPTTPIDIDELVGDDLTIPYYDKSQALPRPQTLDIPHRVSKTRVVKDVVKTNQVRGAGACIKCRLQRISCSTSYPCETCKKAYPQYHQTPEVCCIRYELSNVARELAFRRFDCLLRKEDAAVRENFRMAQPRFSDNVIVGHILFDRDTSKPGLPAVLRNYVCSADGRNVAHRGCTFARDHNNAALQTQPLIDWVENLASPVENSTFEGALESFVKICARSNCLNNFRPEIRTLAQKAHVVKCMYMIYRSRTLYFFQANKVQELPGPAHAEIRGVARSALESSERDLLAELDKFFKTQKQKLDDKERPIVWAALWQLMLVYRDLLRNMKPFGNNAEPLLNAVAVFYGACFRTSASLKLSLETLKDPHSFNLAQQAELADAFKYTLSLRDTFYQSIVAGVATIDQRLKDLVVAPEMKVLNRRPNKKATNGKLGDDLVMGGC